MAVVYQKIIRPLLFGLPAETAHDIGMAALRFGLGSQFARGICSARFASGGFGELNRFGLTFRNPVGIAAGFDKNAKAVNQLAALGFGFVEVGTVTMEPQPGNPKPRLFRLPEDRALINRLGFNSEGALKVSGRLKRTKRDCVIGVNIGKNRYVPNEEAIPNYLKCFDAVFETADYIAVNVSSPNTPGLRELQRAEELEELLSALQRRNAEFSKRTPEGGTATKPLLVKISPDLTDGEIEAIVDICLGLGVSGIIAANTTTERTGLRTSPEKLKQIGAGGLSGKPLEVRSNEIIRKIYGYSNRQLPIIGVGGVFTPEDAFSKIASGACLVQAYTGFIYNGPAFARDLNRGLSLILKSKGFCDLDAAIGSEA